MGVEGDCGGADPSSKAQMQRVRAESPGGGKHYPLPSLYPLSVSLPSFTTV